MTTNKNSLIGLSEVMDLEVYPDEIAVNITKEPIYPTRLK